MGAFNIGGGGGIKAEKKNYMAEVNINKGDKVYKTPYNTVSNVRELDALFQKELGSFYNTYGGTLYHRVVVEVGGGKVLVGTFANSTGCYFVLWGVNDGGVFEQIGSPLLVTFTSTLALMSGFDIDGSHVFITGYYKANMYRVVLTCTDSGVTLHTAPTVWMSIAGSTYRSFTMARIGDYRAVMFRILDSTTSLYYSFVDINPSTMAPTYTGFLAVSGTPTALGTHYFGTAKVMSSDRLVLHVCASTNTAVILFSYNNDNSTLAYLSTVATLPNSDNTAPSYIGTFDDDQETFWVSWYSDYVSRVYLYIFSITGDVVTLKATYYDTSEDYGIAGKLDDRLFVMTVWDASSDDLQYIVLDVNEAKTSITGRTLINISTNYTSIGSGIQNINLPNGRGCIHAPGTGGYAAYYTLSVGGHLIGVSNADALSGESVEVLEIL